MTIAKLNTSDPRLAKHRRAAEKIGDTPEEFSAWVDRMFERCAALDDREAAAKDRERDLDQREKALTRRERAVAAQLAEMRERLGALVEEPA
jgi:DNA repair ATPase RecN